LEAFCKNIIGRAKIESENNPFHKTKMIKITCGDPTFNVFIAFEKNILNTFTSLILFFVDLYNTMGCKNVMNHFGLHGLNSQQRHHRCFGIADSLLQIWEPINHTFMYFYIK